MRTDYGNESDFWEYFGALWGCTPIFTDSAKDPAPAPLGGDVIIIDMPPASLRTEEPRHPQTDNGGVIDLDDTQKIIVVWEGGKDNEPLQ